MVGAGIGGLCTAIRLLKKGYKVTIYEKENTIGGKVNINYGNGAHFDLTASILMTPKIYTEIFESVGRDYKDYIDLVKLDPIYSVNYYDGTSYEFYSDLRKMIDVLENIEKGLSVEYLISKENFLNKPMENIYEVMNFNNLNKLLHISPIVNTNKYISSKISNQKLKEYLIFQSMYIGSNPFTTSNLYTLIPVISHIYGLWHIKGGFYKYILALEKLIYELGGKIETGKEVTKIIVEDKKVKGIVIDNKAYSCSVFIIYLGLNKRYDNLNVVVRVPNLLYKDIQWNEENTVKFRDTIINQIKKIKGLEDIEESIKYEDYLTPIDLRDKFNSYNGTAFGLSHKLSQTTCFRPSIKSKSINGLYFIGSSTHPGNGVSVIIDGSKLVENEIENDF